jgi:hypothetical protein
LVQEILGRPYAYGGYVNTINVCSGGPGYFLSRDAARIVGNAGNLNSWAEDLAVGQVLGQRDIYPISLPGHIPGFSDHWIWPSGQFDPARIADKYVVTLHAVQPDTMRAWWEWKKRAV